MKDISEFLLGNDEVPPVYDVTQPSVYSVIGGKGIRRATVQLLFYLHIFFMKSLGLGEQD